MDKKSVNKKTWIIIGVVAALLAVLGVGGFLLSQGSTDQEENMLQLGQRYLDELNYEQAVACFEEYLEIDPKCVEAYVGLAEAYVGLEEYAEALEVLEKGYAATGDESLQNLRQQYEEMIGVGDNVPEDDATDSDGAADEDEHDPRFEACVVDGIYHNGYEYYDLTLEEEEYLQALIDQAQQENIDEVFSLLGGDALITLFQNHEAFREYDDYNYGNLHIAFHLYKVYCAYNSRNDIRELALIPLEEENGYYFCEGLGTHSTNNGEPIPSKYMNWTISDCRNGMFDGQFVHCRKSETLDENHISDEDMTGKVINGLLDGAVIHHQTSSTNREFWSRSDYVLGQVNVFEEEVKADGSITSWYEYSIDENGEPGFKTGENSTKKDMDEKRWSVDIVNRTGREMDGGMRYYPW